MVPNLATLLPLSPDPTGTPRLLKNDSACGTSVVPQPDGSVAVETAFDGCYTKAQRGGDRWLLPRQDGSYRTTVQIEGVRPDRQMTSYKKELRCPEPRLVLDPPSASLCSAVQLADRLPCGSGRVSHGECSHWGCCFDHRDRVTPCYYGKAVTARCTPEGSFSLAISRDAVLPPLRLDSLHLRSSRGGRCGPVARNKIFVVFNFPLSACGTTFKVSGEGHRVYENELSADGRVLLSSSGSITQDSNFRLTIHCSYSGDESLPVSVLVASLPPPPAIAQQGPLALEMRIARDETYSSYYVDLDYPVVKLLRDPIHLEVRLLGRRDPALVLLLHECWATPSTNPLRKPQWPLLESGCPYRGDNYQTQLVPLWRDLGLPFPSHHQRFIVRTFTLVDMDSQRMLTGPVYFHCSASVCVPSAREQCSTCCEASTQGRRQRDARGGAPAEPGRVRMLASAGPVDFFSQAVEASLPEGSRALPSEGFLRWEDGLSLAAGVAAVLAFGSMVLVVLRRRGEQHAGEGLSCA
ncbi:zona pellucida sperm-binding protein 4-like [Python bivittatus]|uniref:Zona pellucida sperm-binding protein 4 n=1 Tax=Python bivittatus TaxID=176946 RepID=A0A9F2WC43_PYTBI|nr:zona pellucida sperm-binding protein 4-like [Python bivittatus]